MKDVSWLSTEPTSECKNHSHSQRKWYSSKFKSVTFRWEVGTVYKTGDICWFNGPFPAGLMPDIRIFCLNLKLLLLPEEKVIGDKGYRGDPKCCTPYEAKNKSYLQEMSVARARHETVHRRFKSWGTLQQIWRHNRHKHGTIF